MPNLKSSKKRAKQSEVRRIKNLTRKTAIKTAIRKVVDSIERGEDLEATKTLLRDVEGQLARAKGKKVFHKNTAQRKISKLAKKVAVAQKAAQ